MNPDTPLWPARRRALLRSLWATVLLAGLTQAQSVEGQPPQDQPVPDTSVKPTRLPFDISGFLAFRSLYNDDLDERLVYREYTGSIFFGKTLGRWVFHSEVNLDTAPEYDSEGIHLFSPRHSLSVKLDSATANYNQRDWLQFRGGFEFIPDYWRTHRYQSTTLTVDEPLLDQNVFPTSLAGVEVHGDKYFERGGISYQLYGGSSQQEEFKHDAQALAIERDRALGGKLVVHVPTRHVLDTFDVGYHLLHLRGPDGGHDRIYGWEVNVEKQRAALLGEFAHATMGDPSGAREYFREGYYLQPSYRLTRQLFAVARYDSLNRDSRFADENAFARQSLGLTYRPTPDISLKVEADRYEPQRGRLPAYYGATMAIVYFFHRP
jgi:hypothetical protein